MKIAFLIAIATFVLAFSGCHEQFIEPDVTAPSAPRGLSTQTGDQMVELSWVPNPEPDVAGYNVYVASSYEGKYTLIGTTSGLHFLDDGVENGKTYYYAVTAFDNSGNESGFSHDLAFETPRPEGFNVHLKDYRSYPDASGYDFSTYSVGPYNDTYTDVFYEYYDGAYYLDVWKDSDIEDVGYTNSIYDIGAAPVGGWSPTKDVPVIAGHTYVVRTWDNHYAKIRVSALSESTVIFDWAYQLQQDNREFKVGSHPARGSLVFGSGAENR